MGLGLWLYQQINRIKTDERGQVQWNNPLGLLIGVIVLIILLVVVFKVLDRL